MPHTHLRMLLTFALLAATLAAISPRPARAAEAPIYGDALAQGWDNWSWASVDLAAASPVHSGSKSIAVTYGAWQGLYLASAGVATIGYTQLRFWIHGGSSGGQQLQLYLYRAGESGGSHGPALTISAPGANSWREVRLALADLGAANTTITGIVWQATSAANQPTLYIDDIALIDDASPDGPVLSAASYIPAAVPADGGTSLVVRANVSDPQGAGDLAAVTLDASALGRGDLALHDDGRNNDGAAGDGVYGALLTVAPGTPAGEQALVLSARDSAGHTSNLPLGSLVVLATPGGSIPASLPQRLGWGTNQWSESGSDWQVQSGVPWDYVYQYITWGWEGWGDNFVQRFVGQAWGKRYIPVVSVYLMLDVPPSTGEGGKAYAEKLKNAPTVQNYLASLERAARQAKGSKPAIFQIDPDFYGFMQQLSNDPANRPAGVIADDPNSYPVALNVAGYANTLAGFGKRIVDLVHQAAPNVLVAPHASMWATNQDPNNVAPGEVAGMAQRTAAFINAMGGSQADLLFVEWSDRDAGSGLRPWWDATNRTLPRPNRALLWEHMLARAAGKRLILWQVPAGNMALDNTCDHYQDNRAAYAFSHPRDLVDAGVIAVLFGGGAGCMTQPSTDGGFIKAQGQIAYARPAAPTGLSASAPGGASVAVRWNESSLPDLWGYRLTLSPGVGTSGSPQVIDTRRAHATTLLLPAAGNWQLRVAAYDAMGNLGDSSAAITVSSSSTPRQTHLALVQR